MGLKMMETFEDKYLFPLSLKLTDTPGNIRERSIHNEFIFKKPTLIFLCFDISKTLNQDQIIAWTDFTIE
jgi:hypothetical protein